MHQLLIKYCKQSGFRSSYCTIPWISLFEFRYFYFSASAEELWEYFLTCTLRTILISVAFQETTVSYCSVFESCIQVTTFRVQAFHCHKLIMYNKQIDSF